MFGFINSQFKGTSDSVLYTSSGQHVWLKPANCKFIYVTLVGAGGAGGQGAVASGGGQGGPGGGSGAITNFMLPGVFTPNQLFFNIGAGGTGSGGATFVSLTSSRTAPATAFNAVNVIAYANGGTAGGAGGTAFTVGTNAARLLQTGLFNTQAGQAGQSPSSTGVTPPDFTNFSTTTSYILGGRAGGGGDTGIPNKGAGYDTSAVPTLELPTISGGNFGTSGQTGNSAFFVSFSKNKPFIVYGGTGGGSATSSSAPSGGGGRGVLGSGGGGGGRAVSGIGNNTVGGQGGDGFAHVVWW